MPRKMIDRPVEQHTAAPREAKAARHEQSCRMVLPMMPSDVPEEDWQPIVDLAMGNSHATVAKYMGPGKEIHHARYIADKYADLIAKLVLTRNAVWCCMIDTAIGNAMIAGVEGTVRIRSEGVKTAAQLNQLTGAIARFRDLRAELSGLTRDTHNTPALAATKASLEDLEKV